VRIVDLDESLLEVRTYGSAVFPEGRATRSKKISNPVPHGASVIERTLLVPSMNVAEIFSRQYFAKSC
jgi:hypothetical protein